MAAPLFKLLGSGCSKPQLPAHYWTEIRRYVLFAAGTYFWCRSGRKCYSAAKVHSGFEEVEAQEGLLKIFR
ncbi:MAG: hypothetical protein CL912_18560 [Deltaproteobacteria bacterium]|nr:hypothetical protein [Deltaproteobacteria bacterium]